MHPFADYIRILGRGKKGARHLSQREARDALHMLLAGQADPLQIGAFLMLLRVKEETPEELAGFVQAARSACQRPDRPIAVDIDWPSYAGKRQPLNFLLAAIALAQSGVRILMHGSAGHTPGRAYAEPLLQQLGFPVCENWEQVRQELDRCNLAYLPLRSFCPGLENLIHLKPVLGLRSIANSLVRLINPLQAQLLASSIFHPAYGPLHQQALVLLSEPLALTFKGEAGEIDIRPEADTRLYQVRNGQAETTVWPRARHHTQEAATDNSADALHSVWVAEDDTTQRQAIIQTMAVLLASLYDLSPEAALLDAEQRWQARHQQALEAQTPLR